MGKKTKNLGKIFFAYQSKVKSGDSTNIDAIRVFSQSRNDVKTWESMRANGKLLNRSILEAISRAEIFACDMTYINFNVYFELGYAIGKQKILLLLINESIKNAKNNFLSFTEFRNIGYSQFKNSEDIRVAYESIDKETVLMEQLEHLNEKEKNTCDVLYIQNSSNSQADLNALEYIKNIFDSSIIDERYESAYETLEWYLSSINKCRIMIVHLSNHNQIDSERCNAINSFYAGLGNALGKKILFLSPTQIIPVDYDDICIQYDDADDCLNKLTDWVTRTQKKLRPLAQKKKTESQEMNLLLLGIGYSVAEHEKDKLVHYFVPTFVFREALKRHNMIIYGRKGAGKTAVYYKLIDEYSFDETVITIQLKPESSEIIEYIRVSNLFDDSITRSTIFSIIWRFLLGSQLLSELHDIVLKRKRELTSPVEEKLCSFYSQHKSILEQGFFKTLHMFHEIVMKDGISADKAVENFAKQYLAPLSDILKEYLKVKKYTKVVVLADNLDKAWSAENDLSLQCDMILTLLQVSDSFQKSFSDKQTDSADVSCVIFLREDIYNYVIERAREPDRLSTMAYRIEWDTCRPLLKDIVEKRMRYVLNYKDGDSVDNLWHDFFVIGENIYALVDNLCLPRPRDIINIFARMFESACNNNRLKVNHYDFSYSIGYYENYLRNNLIAENSAEYPYLRELITYIDTNLHTPVKYNVFMKVVFMYTNDELISRKILSLLFMNKVIIGSSRDNKNIFYSDKDFLKVTSRAKNNWLLFRKSYLIARRDLSIPKSQ
jgi:uncharacterized protein with HEPN domain